MKVKNILVSQPKPTTGKSPYFDLQEQYGVNVTFHQFIRIEELEPKEFRAQHINILDYSAIIFNSRHGVDHFFHLCKEMRVKIPETMHYFCISETIANYLQKFIEYRKRRVFFAPNNKMEELVPMMHRRNKDRFLMVLADVHNDDVINMFADHNIEVTPAIFYRTVANPLSEAEKAIDYDMFVLFTTTGVQSFLENYPNFQQEDKVFAAFGPATAAALEDAGYNVNIKAPTPKCPSLTTAIANYLRDNQEE